MKNKKFNFEIQNKISEPDDEFNVPLLEKKFEMTREIVKEPYCLYCGENKVKHKKYNLCKECRDDFGHNYLREL